MNKLVSDKLQDIAQLCQMYSVKSMYLFGSAGNEEFFNVDSDIDFLIAFKEISVEEYTIKYYYDDNHPTCSCGCGTKNSSICCAESAPRGFQACMKCQLNQPIIFVYLLAQSFGPWFKSWWAH